MDFTKAKRNLERNGFEVHVFKTGTEAAAHLNEELNDVSIGFGGSKTLDQLGLYESLSEHNDVYWHWRQDADYAREKSMNTDIYMSSANGLAETGEIIFVDGNGNRAASILWGHKKLILVVGSNKLAPDYTMAAIESLKRFPFIDTEVYVNEALDKGTPILAEGAQGSLLDIDFGTYPFVTSSNTLTAGVCTGLGIAPSRVGNVYGIFKAYCTRVGSGPFPTELFDEDGERLRQIGHEFGATTGRPRRTGWLDMVALKYTVMMNGVTDLIMMKSDVLDTFDTIKVAVAYEENGKTITNFPYDGGEHVKPVYKEFPGWKTSLSGLRRYEDFPEAFKQYISYIEKETGCRIKIVSVGPDRDATVVRY